MKVLIVPLFLISSVAITGELPGEISGEVQAQYRYYFYEGEYGNTDQHQISLVLQPEFVTSWDNERNVITVKPFVRLDNTDSERSHGDIRELSLVSSWAQWELRLGVSKVFWGVTESQHLVDVINQTDFIENPDGEQKLGQPMINTTLVADSGNYDFFILPYFRERTFSGADGRYRGPLLVDSDNAQFTDDKEHKHIDYAFRWSTYWQDYEWALSWFKGTDREPVFELDKDMSVLIPVYGQSEQVGLELQYIYKDLLVKAELLNKKSDIINTYSASTIGFEYTFYNVSDRIDIGALYEWLHDSREKATPTGMYDASFLGTRVAMNDEATTEILVGAIFNHDEADMILFRIEASRRISQDLSLDLEVNLIGNPPVESMLHQFRSDDYIQLDVSVYF
jgi:hypothetical protein